MSETTVDNLDALTTLAAGDLLMVLDDLGAGSYQCKKVTFENLSKGTTSPTFQIDSNNSGPKIKNSSGELQVRNAADDADANLRAANLTIPGVASIGATDSPGSSMDVVRNAYPVMRVIRLTTGTSGSVGTFACMGRTSGNMVDGFGAQLVFFIEDDAGVANSVVAMSGVRSGADNSGKLSFDVYKEGVQDKGVLVVTPDGYTGIGKITPNNPLAVNRSADGVIVDFASGGTVQGNVSISGATTSYNAFVGSHYTQLKDGQKPFPVGAVVISTGEIVPCESSVQKVIIDLIEVPLDEALETVDAQVDAVETKMVKGKQVQNKKIIGEKLRGYDLVDGKIVPVMDPIYEKVTIKETRLKAGHEYDPQTGKIYKTITTETTEPVNVSGKEYFPYVDTTNKEADQRVYGVWMGKMSDDARGQAFGVDSRPVYLIAQVGLFKIRVTDTNGDISNGDWLETSSRMMESQKQVDPARTSSSIAKALVDVAWGKESVDPELGYKWKLIPCIF